MKTLFINGIFPALSQTFVHDHVKGLIEAGSDVEVLALRKTDFIFENSVKECAEDLVYYKPYDLKLIKRCVIGFLRRPLLSYKALFLRVQKKIHLQTLISFLQLRNKPDIIITHFGNNYAVGTQLKKYLFKESKHIVIFHGHDVTSYVEMYGWERYRKVEQYIDHALCVNQKFATLLSENTKIKNVQCLYLGTNLPEINRYSHNQEEIQLLFVGRMVEKKGLLYLVLACNLLKQQGVKFKVHCVGDGTLKSNIQKQIIAADLEDNFVLYGAQQHSFVMDLMSRCDVFVLPSITAKNKDSEGLPVVIMEAMNAGLIVLSTYHSGIPELVTNEETGYLIEEGDFINLANAIKKIQLLSAEQKEDILMKAKEAVRNQHDKTQQVKKLVSIVIEGNRDVS